MDEKEEIKEFRKKKITEEPKNDIEEYLREEMIEKERGTNVSEEKILENIRKSYWEIIDVLKKYMDMREDYYPLVSVWIIGTYLHEQFLTYPYLFFNAMKGSGKSRVLELIAELSYEGRFTKSPTEAVLFRTTGTLCIDEFERVGKKEQSSVRELLNSAYKKGIKVSRMKKIKNLKSEEYKVDDFDVYRPVSMANIWGMEEVLGDRCINLILDKSDDDIKTRLVQDYKTNDTIKNIKFTLNQCRLCSVVSKKKIYEKWNCYVLYKYTTTLNTLTTLTTQQHSNTIKMEQLYNKIYNTNIKGRSLELFLPLFFLAFLIDSQTLNDLLNLARIIDDEKKVEDEVENRDISLIDFVSKQESIINFIPIKKLYNEFLSFIDEIEQNVSIWWFGKALKRLNLIIEKRRISRGKEVILNVSKAKEKIKMFRKGGK